MRGDRERPTQRVTVADTHADGDAERCCSAIWSPGAVARAGIRACIL